MSVSAIDEEIVVRMLPVEMTIFERQDKANSLAVMLKEFEEEEDARRKAIKHYRDALKDKREIMDKTALQVNTGLEDREVECRVCVNLRDRVREVWRCDTQEVVESKPLTRSELMHYAQTSIEDYDEDED